MHFPPEALVLAATTGLILGMLLVAPPSAASCNSGRPRAVLYATLPLAVIGPASTVEGPVWAHDGSVYG